MFGRESQEEMKQMLLHPLGAMQAMRPSDQNLAAVEPCHDELGAILAE
jgi:hypothetical protein